MLSLPDIHFITLSDGVLILLIMVSAVALVCIDQALKNLRKEAGGLRPLSEGKVGLRRIEELIRKYSDGQIRDEKNSTISEPYDAIVCHAQLLGVNLNSSAAVQRYLFADNPEAGNSPMQHAGYIAERLYSILCSVSTSNIVRKVPPLEDLQELTMQKERGSLSTSCFRMLIPSILVLGILGTLLGVHDKLPEVDKADGMLELAGALLPGSIAVGSTVAAMLFRGLYNKAWSSFVADFNDYTATRLLPFFRPISQTQADMDKLGMALKKVTDSYSHMQELWKSVCLYKRGVQVHEDGIARVVDLMHENLKELGSAMKCCQELHNRNLKWQENAAGCLVKVSESYTALGKRLADCQKVVQQVENLVESMHRQMVIPALGAARSWGAFRSTARELRELRQKLEAYSSRGFDMPGVAGENERLASMIAWQNELPARVAEYSETVEGIAAIDENIDSNVDVMRDAVDAFFDDASSAFSCLPGRYGILQEHSSSMQKEFCSLADGPVRNDLSGMLQEVRSLHSRYAHFNKYYPRSWAGFKMRCKDKVMQLRGQEKVRIGFAVALLAMILWSALLIIV